MHGVVERKKGGDEIYKRIHSTNILACRRAEALFRRQVAAHLRLRIAERTTKRQRHRRVRGYGAQNVPRRKAETFFGELAPMLSGCGQDAQAHDPLFAR